MVMLKADNQKLGIPPKPKLTHGDFNIIPETSSYRVFEAKPSLATRINSRKVYD